MTAPGRHIAILAEGTLDFHHGKTAVSLLRYRPDDVVAVIDSDHAGMTVGDALGLAASTPIVAHLRDSLAFGPDTLLIGIAPKGGGLPTEWREQILLAIEHGLTVVSGLHYMLTDDEEFSRAARDRGVSLVDVRCPPPDLSVAEGTPHSAHIRVITFVGSDCASGKMTAALEITAAARRRELSATFVATGQTGIMLAGKGIAIDRVIGDFMAGAAERLVLEAAMEAEWVFVEGQGSLFHPAYSGVTLALLHGSAPDGMILVHRAGQQTIEGYDVTIPSLDKLIQAYEDAASWVKPAPVLAVALNTRHLSDEEATAAIEQARLLTGIPVTDPVRFGADDLVALLLERYPGIEERSRGVPEQVVTGNPSARV